MTQTQTSEPPLEPLLTMKDIAGMLGIGSRTLQSWLAGGHMPQADVRVGRTRRWRRETLITWLDEQSQKRAA